MRGGHQVTWAIDGVPMNTNIASNIGPQIDPKDIDYIEAQRGGYSSAYGDRTYGLKLKKVTDGQVQVSFPHPLRHKTTSLAEYSARTQGSV